MEISIAIGTRASDTFYGAEVLSPRGNIVAVQVSSSTDSQDGVDGIQPTAFNIELQANVHLQGGYNGLDAWHEVATFDSAEDSNEPTLIHMTGGTAYRFSRGSTDGDESALRISLHP